MQLQCHRPRSDPGSLFNHLGSKFPDSRRLCLTGRGNRGDEKRQAEERARRISPAGASGAGTVAMTVLLKLVTKLPETDPEQLGGSGLDTARTRQRHLEIPL